MFNIKFITILCSQNRLKKQEIIINKDKSILLNNKNIKQKRLYEHSFFFDNNQKRQKNNYKDYTDLTQQEYTTEIVDDFEKKVINNKKAQQLIDNNEDYLKNLQKYVEDYDLLFSEPRNKKKIINSCSVQNILQYRSINNNNNNNNILEADKIPFNTLEFEKSLIQSDQDEFSTNLMFLDLDKEKLTNLKNVKNEIQSQENEREEIYPLVIKNYETQKFFNENESIFEKDLHNYFKIIAIQEKSFYQQSVFFNSRYNFNNLSNMLLTDGNLQFFGLTPDVLSVLPPEHKLNIIFNLKNLLPIKKRIESFLDKTKNNLPDFYIYGLKSILMVLNRNISNNSNSVIPITFLKTYNFQKIFDSAVIINNDLRNIEIIKDKMRKMRKILIKHKDGIEDLFRKVLRKDCNTDDFFYKNKKPELVKEIRWIMLSITERFNLFMNMYYLYKENIYTSKDRLKEVYLEKLKSCFDIFYELRQWCIVQGLNKDETEIFLKRMKPSNSMIYELNLFIPKLEKMIFTKKFGPRYMRKLLAKRMELVRDIFQIPSELKGFYKNLIKGLTFLKYCFVREFGSDISNIQNRYFEIFVHYFSEYTDETFLFFYIANQDTICYSLKMQHKFFGLIKKLCLINLSDLEIQKSFEEYKIRHNNLNKNAIQKKYIEFMENYRYIISNNFVFNNIKIKKYPQSLFKERYLNLFTDKDDFYIERDKFQDKIEMEQQIKKDTELTQKEREEFLKTFHTGSFHKMKEKKLNRIFQQNVRKFEEQYKENEKIKEQQCLEQYKEIKMKIRQIQNEINEVFFPNK